MVSLDALPPAPALLRARSPDGAERFLLWRDGRLRDLGAAGVARLHGFDRLLALPLAEARHALESSEVDELPAAEASGLEWLPPVETQEVWAAGVTYLRSRAARMEVAISKDIYAHV